MTCAALLSLAVLFLSEPPAAIDARTAAAISEDANAVYESADAARKPIAAERGARIVSDQSDFDRKQGVAMFEGHVLVTYGTDCTMAADQLFVFLNGTNKLSRIVALGNVAITNETRVGTCAMAEFRRRTNEIELFGDGKAVAARLADQTGGSDVCGSRVRFWLDSEQVEVENSSMTAGEQQGSKGVL